MVINREVASNSNLLEEKTARVTAVHRERFELLCEGERIFGRVKVGTFVKNDAAQFPTAGDYVTIQYNPIGDSVITATQPRSSYFSRRDPGPNAREQVIAANFDYVFIMASLNQDFNPRRLERYLALAWQSGGTPVILLTKSDLIDDYLPQLAQTNAIAPGVDVHAISAQTRAGLTGLNRYLASDNTIVLLGSSGVGKSTLLNALAGQDVMAVNTIRADDDKGRHTTTHRQLVTLPSGVNVIDTPGMRELGMWDASSSISDVFDDVESLLGYCRFSNCGHQSEPGCAITTAFESGELERARWESYQKLAREAQYADDRAAAIKTRNEQMRAQALWSKEMQKYGLMKL